MTHLPSFLFHAVFLSILLAVSHSLLKWVSDQGQSGYLKNLLDHWYLVIFALAIYAFIFFYYIFVLKTTSISLLYPVYTGLSVVFVFVAGQLFFGEEPGAMQQLGAIFVICGIVLLGKG